MCEGIVEHGQHVGCRHNPGVVTPGGDQQPVVDLSGDKRVKESIPPQLLITESICGVKVYGIMGVQQLITHIITILSNDK